MTFPEPEDIALLQDLQEQQQRIQSLRTEIDRMTAEMEGHKESAKELKKSIEEAQDRLAAIEREDYPLFEQRGQSGPETESDARDDLRRRYGKENLEAGGKKPGDRVGRSRRPAAATRRGGLRDSGMLRLISCSGGELLSWGPGRAPVLWAAGRATPEDARRP